MSSSFAVESAIDVSGYCYNLTVETNNTQFSVFCLQVKFEIINKTEDNRQGHRGNDGDGPEKATQKPGSWQILEAMQRGLRAVNLAYNRRKDETTYSIS